MLSIHILSWYFWGPDDIFRWMQEKKTYGFSEVFELNMNLTT